MGQAREGVSLFLGLFSVWAGLLWPEWGRGLVKCFPRSALGGTWSWATSRKHPELGVFGSLFLRPHSS